MRFDKLFAELKERRVGRVAIGYAVVGWLAIQAAEIAFEAFQFPASWLRLFIVVVAIGFPVALVLSWMYDLTPGGIQRAEHTDPAVARGMRPALRLLAGLAVIGAIGMAAIPLLRIAGDGGDIADPRKSLIVFPFEGHSLPADLEYLEDASANLLGLAAGQWDDMRVFDDERTGSMLRKRSIQSAADIDFDTARELAVQAGIGTFVLGEIRLSGPARDSLTIEAKAYDTNSGDRLILESTTSAASADPRPAIGDLAARILQVSGAPPGDRPDLLTQTTHSLEAYREYLAGSRAFQLLIIDSAQVHFDRAVELDSTFALAYLKLAELDGWDGIEGTGNRSGYIAKAVAHSADLPTRYRMLVDLHQAYGAGRLSQARRTAEQMIERDSLDVEAWYQLGESHFHDNSSGFPHPDTAGDLGIALRAFQKALELDSAYVLAYVHIVDALGNCGASAPWLCLGDDSTVYAPNDELVERFGQVAVDSIRAASRAERLDTAAEWARAAPNAERARSTLMVLMFEAGRYSEVLDQVAVLDEVGHGVAAQLWRARIKHAREEYAAAADDMEVAISGNPLELFPLFNVADPELIVGVLGAGGRAGEGVNFIRRLVEAMPMDTVDANNMRYHKRDLATSLELEALASLGVHGELMGPMGHQWLDVLDGGYGPGTEDHQVRWAISGGVILGTYLASRDTTLLVRYLATVDTLNSRSWEPMAAQLALARGDTAEASARLARRYPDYDAVEFSGRAGTPRLYAWADMLDRTGRAEEAADLFALFDSEADSKWSPVYQVRSWLERARIHESLGDTESARDLYQRFISAWQEGDEVVQPLVDEARARLVALGS